MTTTITILLTLLQPFIASAGAPNLCADAILKSSGEPVTDLAGTTLARYCEQTAKDAPIWADDVCCDIHGEIANCTPTGIKGTCSAGEKRYCKYGERLANGSVTCYQPLPSAAIPGGGTVQATEYIQAESLCCQNGECYELSEMMYPEDCNGYWSWCWYGILNEDGTVDCFD